MSLHFVFVMVQHRFCSRTFRIQYCEQEVLVCHESLANMMLSRCSWMMGACFVSNFRHARLTRERGIVDGACCSVSLCFCGSNYCFLSTLQTSMTSWFSKMTSVRSLAAGKEAAVPEEFESVSTKTYRMGDIYSSGLHAFYPATFDEYHFGLVNVMVLWNTRSWSILGLGALMSAWFPFSSKKVSQLCVVSRCWFL